MKSLTGGALTDYFLNLGFSRAQELEAEKGALLRLQKAKIDNGGFKNFFERLDRDSVSVAWLSDHPSNDARRKLVTTFANGETSPILRATEWQQLKNICRDNRPG